MTNAWPWWDRFREQRIVRAWEKALLLLRAKAAERYGEEYGNFLIDYLALTMGRPPGRLRRFVDYMNELMEEEK